MIIKGQKEFNLGQTFIAILAISIVSASLAVGCGNSTESIKLRLSSPYFETTAPSIYATHMCDLVEEKTNGKVKIERFYGGTLGSDKEHLQMVASGSVDMAVVAMSINAQQYPLNDAQPSNLPFDLKKTVDLINQFREIPEVKAIMETEQVRTNIKVFPYNAAGVSGIVIKESITSMKDLEGKKINTMGPTSRAAWEELGWLPVNLSISDVYESLSRGVIDGGFGAISATMSMRWYESAKTYFCLDAWSAEIPICMNLEKYNSLPADVQEAILDAANETVEWSINFDKDLTTAAFNAFEAAGCKVIMATPDERNLYCDISIKYKQDYWLEVCEKARLNDKAETMLKIWNDMYTSALGSNW